MNLRQYSTILVVVLILFITYLHYSTAAAIHTLHNIYRELYYIPVLLGALAYGLAGALLSYILIFALYLPYVIMTWPGSILNETNRLLPLLMQGIFAFAAGYLVDRERKHRTQLEKARYLADVGRIATIIVHDLKNPLIAILGFARRINEGKGNTGTALRAIIDSAEQMQKIVSSVLDFARPVQLERKKTDLRDIVQQAADSCRMKAEQREVTLSIDLPPVPVQGSFDGFHLERAMVNLITNAIEASNRSQRVLIILARRSRVTAVSISDDGPGMDRETLENIFVPFYTRKRGGTGLGMSIAKKIIESHDGSIRVSSSPGQGTEVTIELPHERKDGQIG